MRIPARGKADRCRAILLTGSACHPGSVLGVPPIPPFLHQDFSRFRHAAAVCVIWPRTTRLVGRAWHLACLASSGMDEQMYDYVVVGGGSAGCVIASRLTEDPHVQVLVLEAGDSHGPDAMNVSTLWPTLIGTTVDWGSQTVPQGGLNDAVLAYPRGRVLGGSSSINAMAFVRAHPSSYNSWASKGAEGWDYDALLPYFQRSECAVGRDPHWRGTNGPMTPTPMTNLHPAAETFLEACEELGFPISDDLNGAEPEGASRCYELTAVDGRRQSVADAYLRPVLDRPNLTVIANALVTRLVFDGTHCTGMAYLENGNHPQTVRAEREVILCAGAIGTPQLLQLSGIGPADHLRPRDIPVIVDLTGVGANLSDHPTGMVTYSAAQPMPAGVNNHCDVLAALRADPASEVPDSHILFADLPLSRTGIEDRAEPGYTIVFSMLRPHSRGSVRLASKDPTAAPLIDPAFLTDERDVTGMLNAMRLARRLGETTAMAKWRKEELLPGPDVSIDTELRAYLRRSLGTYWHPAGTCAMGSEPDAVVDLDLRVHGVDGLRVADASVMPSVPAANPNATVVAIAERAAEIIYRNPAAVRRASVSRTALLKAGR
jgi:choline dehydrogenase